jgi:hypothetical protein
MIGSFSEINLNVFVEIARIKKPQKIAFQAGRMVVLLVNTFREKPALFDDFMAWQRIQSFINANVNKFT